MTGKAPGTGLFGLGRNNSKTLKFIRDALEAAIEDPVQHRLLHCGEYDGMIAVNLHPAAEDVEISVDRGSVLISAKTSTIGPGYHAMLVDLVDEVARRANITLAWEGDGDNGGDETDYHEHRDMKLLREETVRWLKTVSGLILEHAGEGVEQFQINMPVGCDMVSRDFFVMSPMGEFQRGWFDAVAGAGESELETMAERFFPAWHEAGRAEYWANTGRYLMLWEVDWTVPADEGQRRGYEDVIACFEQARKLDPTLPLPEAELGELGKLLESREVPSPPATDGFGFRRGPMMRPVGSDWSAEIPGYFRLGEDVHENGRHQYYWFGAREVHFSTLGFRSTDDGMTAADMVGGGSEDDNREELGFKPANDWMATDATSRWSDDHWTVQASFGVSHNGGHDVLVLTIVHEDGEEGRTWAKALLESVTCPGPDAD